jgi:hypothetical protein
MMRIDKVRSFSTTQIAHVEDFDKLYSTLAFIFLIEDLPEKVSDDEEEEYNENYLPAGKIIFEFNPMITIKGTKYED